MVCVYCGSVSEKRRQKYCSKACYSKGRIGTKRPDVVIRNTVNNPMSSKASLEKMRKSQTGKKASSETKAKMSEKRRRFLAAHPDHLANMMRGADISNTLKSLKSPSWKVCRLKALQRDNWTCQKCGETRRNLLVVHHLDYRGKNLRSNHERNNKLDNLVTWCHKCHNGFHRHKAADYRERMQAIVNQTSV